VGQEAKEVFRVAVNVSIINAAGGWFPVALSIPVPRELNWRETFQHCRYSVQKYWGRDTGFYIPASPTNPLKLRRPCRSLQLLQPGSQIYQDTEKSYNFCVMSAAS